MCGAATVRMTPQATRMSVRITSLPTSFGSEEIGASSASGSIRFHAARAAAPPYETPPCRLPIPGSPSRTSAPALPKPATNAAPRGPPPDARSADRPRPAIAQDHDPSLSVPVRTSTARTPDGRGSGQLGGVPVVPRVRSAVPAPSVSSREHFRNRAGRHRRRRAGSPPPRWHSHRPGNARTRSMTRGCRPHPLLARRRLT
jgi:hypothetical protein